MSLLSLYPFSQTELHRLLASQASFSRMEVVLASSWKVACSKPLTSTQKRLPFCADLQRIICLLARTVSLSSQPTGLLRRRSTSVPILLYVSFSFLFSFSSVQFINLFLAEAPFRLLRISSSHIRPHLASSFRSSPLKPCEHVTFRFIQTIFFLFPFPSRTPQLTLLTPFIFFSLTSSLFRPLPCSV